MRIGIACRSAMRTVTTATQPEWWGIRRLIPDWPMPDRVKQNPIISVSSTPNSVSLCPPYFTTKAPLDRHSIGRNDDPFHTTNLFLDKNAKFILFEADSNELLDAFMETTKTHKLAFFTVETVSKFLNKQVLWHSEHHRLVYLGRKWNENIYALLVRTTQPDWNEFKAGLCATLPNARPAAFQLDSEEASLYAYARSLIDFRHRSDFCTRCSHRLTAIQSGYVLQCTNEKCVTRSHLNNTLYPRTDPVVLVLILSQDAQRALLVRHPQRPTWSCVAGFMEPGETIEDAARREVLEETGLQSTFCRYLVSQPWPFPASLMLGCVVRCDDPLGGQPHCADGELEAVQWFTLDQVRQSLNKRNATLSLAPKVAMANVLLSAWLEAMTDQAKL